MHALLLTAGLGTRLRPYTLNVPKPAIPFLNVPQLGFPLFYLEQAGLTNLICNTHHLPQRIEKTVNEIKMDRYSVSFSHEVPHILGGGGAVKKCQSLLQSQESFFLLNGDNPLVFQDESLLSKMTVFHQTHQPLATMMLVPHPLAGRGLRSAWVDEKTLEIRHFGETCEDPHLKPYHNIGIHVLSSQIFDKIPEGEVNLLYEVLLPQITQGKTVKAFLNSDLLWYETGNIEDYLKATEQALEVLFSDTPYAESLKKILNRFTPEYQMKTSQNAKLLTEVEMDLSLNLDRFAVISRGAHLAPKTKLSGHVIASKTPILLEDLLVHKLIL